jgi:hypothetical protein
MLCTRSGSMDAHVHMGHDNKNFNMWAKARSILPDTFSFSLITPWIITSWYCAHMQFTANFVRAGASSTGL